MSEGRFIQEVKDKWFNTIRDVKNTHNVHRNNEVASICYHRFRKLLLMDTMAVVKFTSIYVSLLAQSCKMAFYSFFSSSGASSILKLWIALSLLGSCISNEIAKAFTFCISFCFIFKNLAQWNDYRCSSKARGQCNARVGRPSTIIHIENISKVVKLIKTHGSESCGQGK